MFYSGFDALFSILIPLVFLFVLGMMLFTVVSNLRTWGKKFGEATERALAMALDAPQTGTRSMSFGQVHVIGGELTVQNRERVLSSRVRLRSSFV